MKREVVNFIFGFAIFSCIIDVDGNLVSCLHNFAIMNVILCMQASPTLLKELPSVRRNGRLLKVRQNNGDVYYNAYNYISLYMPSFGSTMYTKIICALHELFSNFKIIIKILWKTAMQTISKLRDMILHMFVAIIAYQPSWNTICIVISILSSLIIMYLFVMQMVKRKIRADLEKFHICVLEKIEHVKRDTELLANDIKMNNDKISQVILTQSSEDEKAYYEDPMFILKGIAQSVRIAVTEHIKCAAPKKRKAIKYCKPPRKFVCNPVKSLEAVRRPNPKIVTCTKSNETLSSIDATYESEKVISLRDKFTQIHRKSQKISIPTYCVSNIAIPQRVWIGGKWYLEDKNELKAVYSTQSLANASSVRIKLQASNNSLISDPNHSFNNIHASPSTIRPKESFTSKLNIEDKSKGGYEYSKDASNSSIYNSYSQQYKLTNNNLTYVTPSSKNEGVEIRTKPNASIQFYGKEQLPIASQSLNVLETPSPQTSWGGGDTYIRKVWSDPKDIKKLNVTYDKSDDFNERNQVIIKTNVSTQTERKASNYSNAPHTQYYYPLMYTSTPKHVHNRTRRHTEAEEYNLRQHESNWRNWWSNYYYGLQPIRL